MEMATFIVLVVSEASFWLAELEVLNLPFQLHLLLGPYQFQFSTPFL